ncbi:ABC transporter ATP-binding protein [Qingshengfaniella alkalisoli]|uniref:ABC transporter ATP-binding protein n=1 Tax=Qingshengfaniella alkalisoli TaxID=2599296 RepID=A0A5B8IZU3_9RHOB|nr:ABC transporter ATP-binding protein [Qingshengfaniella alkalisoli]QDY71073.1 ABC transporter ATP-binding protein [Qingshengfaniella alkalisoli]
MVNVPLLSLKAITKRYPGLTANDAIDLDVRSGEIHAVLGENGAGKSTLMKIIYGVEQADGGDIFWQGDHVPVHNPSRARALGIGMVFQHFSLFETLSVVENISMTVPGKKADLAAKVRELGITYNLTVDPHAAVHTLSVGERQRVEIIRCLMQDLRLLILDEPTSVLPPQHVEVLFDALRKLRDSGVAILYISHKLEEIRTLCDTATILQAGRVSGTVVPREKTARDLAQLMIGRSIPAIEARPHAPDTGGPLLGLNKVYVPSDDPFGISLKDVSLSVKGGEIVGIAGISGNGQKELSRVISGEFLCTELSPAAIMMMGKPVADLDAAARRRLGFAFVPEERLGRGAVPEMSLASNTILTASEHGLVRRGFVDRPAVTDFAMRCIRDFDVRCNGPETRAGALSGGNLQKFIVGRELHLKPKLLFVAQPTWGVDIGAATEIRRKLLALRDDGVAILIISEEMDELFEVTDRLHVIHGGALSRSLRTSEVTANDIGRYMIGAEE